MAKEGSGEIGVVLENLALDNCGGMPENPQFGVWNVSHYAS